jgi:hypothetical protein
VAAIGFNGGGRFKIPNGRWRRGGRAMRCQQWLLILKGQKLTDCVMLRKQRSRNIMSDTTDCRMDDILRIHLIAAIHINAQRRQIIYDF